MVGLGVAAALALALGAEGSGHSLADVSFMAGAWEASPEKASIREVWDPARGDAMVGHFSVVHEGAARLYELMVLEEDASGVTLRIRHFNRGLEPWASEADGPLEMRLIDAGEGRAVFEDAERDFPHRITYVLDGDALSATLEASPGSKRMPETLEMRKAE